MRFSKPRPMEEDPFAQNRAEIAKANAYLLKRVAFCAFLNMSAMSAASPFLSGFAASAPLYVVSAVLTGLFSLCCYFWLNRCLRAALPLFYALLAGLCGYAVALSCFYYRDINGVTIVGIFMLVPMVLLDRTWRVNLMFFLYYAVSCVFAFANKPFSLAVDDCVTCGAFMVFGMLIGSYLRNARLQAIEQKRLLELQRDRDALTGLPNRRLLFETLEQADRDHAPNADMLAHAPFIAGVIMLDIDDFKGYNDRHGHQAGDECLRRLGRLYLSIAAETGVTVYRYGGEEFLGLWREGAAQPLDALAARLVAQSAACDLPGERVTVSIGYARRQTREEVGTERLISMADSALYEAKRQGRNRAVGFHASGCEAFNVCPTLRQRGK